MAKNLFQKLNTLLQATVQDAVQSATRPISNLRSGKNPDRQVAAIRKQLAVAEAEEQKLLQQQTRLDQEILQLDEQADAAVQAGREAEARHLIQQLETRKQQVAILNSEISQLRRAMSDFMRQVNDLETHLNTSKQQAQPAEIDSTATTQKSRKVRVETEATVPSQEQPLRIEIVESIAVDEVDEAVVEQDLAARRARLAKPGDKA